MIRVFSIRINQVGFTLLEIIVALILIAITGALMFPVMRTNLVDSVIPIQRVDHQYLLIREMERLTGLYREEIRNGTLDINAFKATHVDTSPYIDVTSTTFVTLSGTGYTSNSSLILQVTLVLNDQTLVTLFTE